MAKKTTNATLERKPRPKTGEPRVTRQPLKIDKLPEEIQDIICELRNRGAGLPWAKIEERSAKPYSKDWAKDRGGFIDWSALPFEVLELFPDLKLPAETLRRWYDIRIEQARAEVLRDGDAAAKFVEQLGKLGIDGMNDAVQNTMVREVFSRIRSAGDGDKSQLLAVLNDVSLVMSRLQRVQLLQKKADAEIARANADKARFEAEAGNPREIYMLAAQDVLKKLNTRKNVRALLTPIQNELIEEIAHAAEAFAKHIEQAAA